MKLFTVILGFVGVLLFMTMPVLAEPLDIVWDPYDGQDDNQRPETDELGDMPPFPADEWITSSHTETDYTPCSINPDNPGTPNYEVTITNKSGQSWWNLQYVADSDTTIANMDDWLINSGFAFLIDNVGLNTPLRSESMTPDLVFEPNETWVFVIQDFVSGWGGPPTPFDSIGVGNQSAGGPPSTGSIIGYIPEPATALFMTLGGLALLRRRN